MCNYRCLILALLSAVCFAGAALAQTPCPTGSALVEQLRARNQEFIQTATQLQQIGQAPSTLGSEARALGLLALADTSADLNQVVLQLNAVVPPCMPQDCPAEVGFTRADREPLRVHSQAIQDAYIARRPKPDAPQSLRALATPGRVNWAKSRLGCGEQTPAPAPAPVPDQSQILAEVAAVIQQIAEAYDEGDYAMAMAQAAPLCELKNPEACFYSGVMYTFGEGVEADIARAIAEEEIACMGGVVLGCNLLGGLYYEAEPPLHDPVRARGAYGLACQANDTPSCVEYARMMAYGEGGPPDTMNALAIANEACQAADGMGCTLSAMIMASQPVADYDMIIEKARLGCEYGDEDGCGLMGVALLEDAIAREDVDALNAALDTLDTHCTNGMRAACSTMAMVYTDEQLGMADALTGQVYAARACALGASQWCN